MGVCVSTRKTAFAFGLACLLLLGVWYPANRDNVSLTADLETLDEAVSDFAYDEVDPAELADFLGVSEDFGSTSLETDLSPVGVSTAELLELEQQEFEYVLSELQETNFF